MAIPYCTLVATHYSLGTHYIYLYQLYERQILQYRWDFENVSILRPCDALCKYDKNMYIKFINAEN